MRSAALAGVAVWVVGLAAFAAPSDETSARDLAGVWSIWKGGVQDHETKAIVVYKDGALSIETETSNTLFALSFVDDIHVKGHTITGRGFKAAVISGTFDDDGRRIELSTPDGEIELRRAEPVLLSGIVVEDETDRPISGAIIDDPPSRAVTDSTGNFSILDDEFGGTVPLRVSAAGRATASVPIDEKLPRLRISLPSAASIRANVVDTSGKPVPGAHVEISVISTTPWVDELRELESDTNGEFHVGDLPQSDVYDVTVRAEGFVRERMKPEGGDRMPWQLVLRRSAHARIEVSKRVSRVVVVRVESGNFEELVATTNGTIDVDVPPDAVLFRAYDPQAGSAEATRSLRVGSRTTLRLALQSTGTVRGRVVDGEGRGVPQVLVNGTPAGKLRTRPGAWKESGTDYHGPFTVHPFTSQVITDSSGRFELLGISAPMVELTGQDIADQYFVVAPKTVSVPARNVILTASPKPADPRR